MKKVCKKCIWFGQCDEEVADCEDYFPALEEEYEKYLEDEYNKDLRRRHQLYRKQVREQNS